MKNRVTEETPEGIRQYHYNPLNEQTKVILGDKTVWKNQYDAEGLRYAAEENGKPSWFIFDMEQNLMAELTETAQISTRYIWGEDVIAAEYPAGTKEDRYYYTQDEQRSTIFLTDENANIKNSYYYDAFGKILEQEETIPNRIRYTGQQWDSAAEQYYLRARYYNPILGRFMQEDVYRGDGLNLYAYCANNPVMFYDPSGFKSFKKEVKDEGKRLLKEITGLDKVPGKDQFNQWFNNLSVDQLDKLYSQSYMKNVISNRFRAGDVHEWLMVAHADTFKKWGLTAEDILENVTATKNLYFKDILQSDGKIGSAFHIDGGKAPSRAHTALEEMIKSSKDKNEYFEKLCKWADEHVELRDSKKVLKQGSDALPEKIKACAKK